MTSGATKAHSSPLSATNFVFMAMVLLSLVAGRITNVNAHAVLVQPLARAGMDDHENVPKIQPRPPTEAQKQSCLTSKPGDIKATYAMGQTVTVKWDITIPHKSDPGILISIASGENMPFTVLASNASVEPGQVQVQLPKDLVCKSCVLNWIWDSESDGGFYQGCSDIAILAASGANSTAASTTAPTKAATSAVTAQDQTKNTLKASSATDVASLLMTNHVVFYTLACALLVIML